MYFLYSDEQIEEKNEVLRNMNKKFVPGIVIINGTKIKFTQISKNSTISRFADTKVVASGDLDKIEYTRPTSEPLGGN